MLAALFERHARVITVKPGDAGPAVVIGPSEPILVRPGFQSFFQIGPAAATQVEPQPRGLWDERGWAVRTRGAQSIYEGHYRVIQRRSRQTLRFAGRIQESGQGILMYIANPPPEIQGHPKGPCFSPEGLPWFRLHWHHPAHNVDDAILYMERILSECVG